MSLPKFDTQGSLFESVGSLAGNLFSDQDRYKLFATKIWPLLAKSREELAACYVLDNGRPGVEPVILLGVLIFQFLERVPDRQSGGTGEVSFGLEAGAEFGFKLQGASSHHVKLFPGAVAGQRQGGSGDADYQPGFSGSGIGKETRQTAAGFDPHLGSSGTTECFGVCARDPGTSARTAQAPIEV